MTHGMCCLTAEPDHLAKSSKMNAHYYIPYFFPTPRNEIGKIFILLVQFVHFI